MIDSPSLLHACYHDGDCRSTGAIKWRYDGVGCRSLLCMCVLSHQANSHSTSILTWALSRFWKCFYDPTLYFFFVAHKFGLLSTFFFLLRMLLLLLLHIDFVRLQFLNLNDIKSYIVWGLQVCLCIIYKVIISIPFLQKKKVTCIRTFINDGSGWSRRQ